MYSPKKFKSRIGRIGSPLPDPFETFKRNQIKFRRGATSMLAGRPNNYKSVTALNFLLKWSEHPLTGQLYMSADSDENTVITRLSAMLTGESTQQVEKDIKEDRDAKYVRALARLDNVRFTFDSMDMEGIADSVASFEQLFGDYPDVVFLDNLIDFVERPDDWGGMQQLIKELNVLSRETKSHIMILHHARITEETEKNSQSPPKEWEIQGKLTQFPKLGLTVAAGPGTVTFRCVKNRTAPKADTMKFQIKQSLELHDWNDLRKEFM